jgi:hypothetical protein
VLGWSSPFYVRQNVNRRRLRKEDIPRETLRVIQAYNELDIDLYRYGKELFQEQVHLQGVSLEKELRMFRKLNASYSMLHTFMASAVTKLRIGARAS